MRRVRDVSYGSERALPIGLGPPVVCGAVGVVGGAANGPFFPTEVAINECDPDPVVEDLGSGVSRKTYQNCEGDVVFYDIEGMVHVWPVHEAKCPGARWMAEYEEVDYLEDALAFFAEHPLP